MKKYFLVLIPFIVAALFLGFIQQDDPLKKLIKQIDRYREGHPVEKIHIHMDKPYYAIGDNIWFKVYVVNAEANELSALSQAVFVELINEKDSVKQSLKLPLTAGLAWGDFALADSLKEGNYRIRAYTTWMRNFGEEYFFDKTFAVGNSISNTVLTNVTYAFSRESKGQKVVADISYTDMRGEPLANKEVNYNIDLDFRAIAKGKGVTDSKGNLQITFINNQPFVLKAGKISTSIKLDETNAVSKTFPVKATSNEVDVQFFPESGELVDGIRSRVGFKAVGADGLGKNVSGYISDGAKNKVVEFKSEHAGMGHFRIQPKIADTFTATVIFEDGSEKTFALPRVLPQGYVLSTNNNDPENLNITVTTNKPLQFNERFTVVAQMNGFVYYVARNTVEAKTFSTSVPKKKFPTGIVQVTLFDADNNPVAERLVFINHSDLLGIDVKASKAETKKREKVTLSFDVKDKKNQPTISSLSVSVLDESKVPYDEDKETTIISNLLLTSDLKGFIEKPNYYFTDINEDKVRQLDILLLTQGWRRFEWKNILGSFPDLSFRPETNVEISGRVKTMSGKPVVGGKVTLLSSAGDIFSLDTLSDSKGEFRFPDLYFSDSTKFIIQARNEKDRKNVVIELNTLPAQLVTKNKNEALVEINVNKSMMPYLENSKNQFDELRRYGLINKSIMLAEVKVVEKKPELKNSSNLNGAGHADAVIKRDVLQNCYSFPECLQGRVAGIFVERGVVYSSRSVMSSIRRGMLPMQVIVDGMQWDAEFVSSINPNEIESVEVLKSGGYTAIYGMMGGGGVLVINTRRANVSNDYKNYAPGVLSYNPKGFYKAREFYAPNYDDPATNEKVGDLRTTVYWNPNVLTDSTGRASVSFFNADGLGNYKVIVEGINSNGSLGRKIYRYSVQ
jgi:hypothetical protein